MNFKYLILFLMLFNSTFILSMKKGDGSLPSQQPKGLAILLTSLAGMSLAIPAFQDSSEIHDSPEVVDVSDPELSKAIQLSLACGQSNSVSKGAVSLREEERKQIVAATAASLDEAAEIAEFRARTEENEKLRMNSSFRFIPNFFNNPRIFHVRSLRQPNAWMCGHYVLFNSRFIQLALLSQDFNHDQLFKNHLQDIFSPGNYKPSSFFEFYREASINAYQKEPEELKRDPFSGELCVDPNFTGKNLLDSDHFSWVTSLLQTPHFYVLRNFITGIDIAPAIYQIGLGDLIAAQGGSEHYLTNLRSNLNGKFALHFACFAGGNHWILVSVVNCFNDIYSPSIFIMDSFNNDLSHHPEMVAYISYLEYIFLRNDAVLKPVVESRAFKLVVVSKPGILQSILGLFRG